MYQRKVGRAIETSPKQRRGKRWENPIVSAPQYGLFQALASGTAHSSSISPSMAQEAIEKTGPRKRSKFAKELARVRNPETAEGMVEAFHGRPPDDIYEVTEIEHFEHKMAILGDLVELEILSEDGENLITIAFKKDRPKLCCDAQGSNLEVIGGDQELEVGNGHKKLVPIGICKQIVYKTDKHHLEDSEGEIAEYQHKFGEEGGEPPVIVYNCKDRKILVVGGSYTIEDIGIKD